MPQASAEAAALIRFMLARELHSGRHQALDDICKKCRAGLYPSLPALISDLEKALDTLSQAEFLNRARAFVQRKKLTETEIDEIERLIRNHKEE